ncbi:MAG TPA: hypothetical protein VFN25_05335 [Dokdonella sp.]|uniref:hypothetical protein n=1 Tax=Dokdonella sp. TaxID=2291710 RepID=UPI002D7F4453|nr:hypothetical protein [Dokdonella sp.]HET9032313.1 hypothetical protein [Dokdonella sp.]
MKFLIWPLLLILTSAHAHSFEDAPFKPAQLSALITEASLDEISGIASSRLSENRYWVHDDSPRPAELQAIDESGKQLVRLRIEGVRAIDWEDIASHSDAGKPWLLIGDIGDNAGVRKDYELIVIEEPELSAKAGVQSIKPAWRLRFRYPDGAHDVEAMAVDVQQRQVLLINKHPPLAVYTLPLGPASTNTNTLVATKLLELSSIPQPDANERKARYPSARFGGSPTGLDIDAAGKRAILLTYRDIWLFNRKPGESWKQAFSRKPKRISLPPLAQAEAIGFDRNGQSIMVSGERLPAPLLKLEPLIDDGSGE